MIFPATGPVIRVLRNRQPARAIGIEGAELEGIPLVHYSRSLVYQPVLTDARRFSCSGGETEREHTRRLLQPFVAAGAPLSGRPRPESPTDLCGGRGRALYLCSSRFDELDIGIAFGVRGDLSGSEESRGGKGWVGT